MLEANEVLPIRGHGLLLSHTHLELAIFNTPMEGIDICHGAAGGHVDEGWAS